MQRIVAFLKSQNTHLAWLVSLALGLFSLVLLGGKGTMEAWSTRHLDGFAGTTNASIEGAAMVALYVLWPALIGAAIGRPPWIAQIGGPFKAKDE